MSDKADTPANTPHDELAEEAAAWVEGRMTPEGWQAAPDAIPRVGETQSINIRIPKLMLTILKTFAQREGIGYQVLMKRWLDDRIRSERDRLRAHRRTLDEAIEALEVRDIDPDTLARVVDSLAEEKARHMLRTVAASSQVFERVKSRALQTPAEQDS